MDKKIVDVNELHVEDVPFVGGKGANLGELTNAGFPVPEAFVLTTVAYDYFIVAALVGMLVKNTSGRRPAKRPVPPRIFKVLSPNTS